VQRRTAIQKPDKDRDRYAKLFLMTSRNTSACFLAFLAFVVLLVCLAFAGRGPNTGERSIALTYQGRTNIIAPLLYETNRNLYATGEFAVFMLKGPPVRNICYEAASVELQTAEGWVTNQTFFPDMPTNWPFFAAAIPAEGRLVFWVPPPSTNELWRIRLACVEKAPGWKGMKDRAVDVWNNLCSAFTEGQETFSGRHFEITSPAVIP
jgi:hypothetical protein